MSMTSLGIPRVRLAKIIKQSRPEDSPAEKGRKRKKPKASVDAAWSGQNS